MIKYTEQELKDKCLSWGIYYHNTCLLAHKQEDKSIEFDKWLAQRIKPAKKIIDMSHFIKSGIDMEFSDDTSMYLGILKAIDLDSHRPYTSKVTWKHCRPRMKHIMFNNGIMCPLPEGFVVKLYYSDGHDFTYSDYTCLHWDQTGLEGDIVGYEILGLADGYAYPWGKVE